VERPTRRRVDRLAENAAVERTEVCGLDRRTERIVPPFLGDIALRIGEQRRSCRDRLVEVDDGRRRGL